MSIALNHSLPADCGCITQVQGITVGHDTYSQRATGCTVVLTPQGATAAVDVRGAAPGTRETDLLAAGNLVEQVHAVLLSGGSAWGLAAADGVVQYLEAQHSGLDTGYGRVPIVPAAVLFDLPTGDAHIRPDATSGLRACQAAQSTPISQGNVGAGSGASIGKLYGMHCAMKGGIGSASVTVGNTTVGALIACNAVGDIINPYTGTLLAGARTAPSEYTLRNTAHSLLQGQAPKLQLAGSNTTIGVLATDAALSRTQLQRLAIAGHNGLARCISPVHTPLDGDTLFAVSTSSNASCPIDMISLSAMATRATELAILQAIIHARTLRLADFQLPAYGDIAPSESGT